MTTSRKQLETLCLEVNKALGRPTTYTNPETRKCEVGHIHIYKSHYGYEVHETVSDGGGVRDFALSHAMTAREVKCLLRGTLEGITISRKYATHHD